MASAHAARMHNDCVQAIDELRRCAVLLWNQ
jgi:hypothetical protein